METYLLKLYVAGETERSRQAIVNLRQICEELLYGHYDLRVIDVLQHPKAAEQQRILATPTLIKELPLPIRRLIGDLSHKEQVLVGLDIQPSQAASPGLVFCQRLVDG